MNDRYYQPIKVLEIDFNTCVGLFRVRTKVGWCLMALFKAELMLERQENFIEDAEVQASGALLSLRYEFTNEQIKQLCDR